MKSKINNFSLAYDIAGEGLPLLFIHGYPLGRSLWESQMSDLSRSVQTISPDLRGHGESEAVFSQYSIESLADDCIQLLDNLEITQPIIICGLSMGGYVAFALYRKYRSRIAGLILTATRAAPDTPEGKVNRKKAIDLALSEGPKAIANSMLPKMFAPATYVNNPSLVKKIHNMMESTSVQGIIGALNAMKNRPDSTHLLKEINVPVLIIHGNQDQLIPVTEAQEMQLLIANSEIVTLENAGHLPNLEQSTLFNQALKQFLTRF